MTLSPRLSALRDRLAASGMEPLAAPWSEDAIAAFEAAHGVALPPDYRAFLGAVGSSGPGPGYGLLAPEPTVFSGFPRVVTTIRSVDGSVVESGTPVRPAFDSPSSVARPFPLFGTFEPLSPYDLPPLGPGETPYDGTLTLCEHGCGYFDFLVVSGRYAGQVWSDTMAAMRDGRIAPTGLGFLDWYERCLDEAT
ncbi:MAG: SMI1/KNR4 family protein [Myxococcota bacterium]